MHFDQLRLVSSLWDGVVLIVSDHFAEVKRGAVFVLTAPHDAEAGALVGFVEGSRAFGAGRARSRE